MLRVIKNNLKMYHLTLNFFLLGLILSFFQNKKVVLL